MKMKYAGASLMVFGAGFLAASNIVRLVDTNPNYDAAWWKVGLALVLAVGFSASAYVAARDRPL